MKMWVILSVLILLPNITIAQSNNAGIVRGLWYDQATVFVDVPVRIYVAVRNNTGADLSGAVEFFVNGERIERNFIDALDGRIVESWADWNPTYGTSSISASLTRTELSSSAEGPTTISVVSALAEDTIFVDYDTDGDGVGNVTDSDDDGDGVMDTDEISRGTNPLVFNEPTLETETTENPDENDTLAETDENESTTEDDTAGLEQFLTDNRASDVLGSFTNFLTNTKKRVDDYRETRALEQERTVPDTALPETNETDETPTTSSSTEEVVVSIGESNASETATSVPHVGEITRSNERGSWSVGGALSTVWSALVTLSGFIYDKFLWLISTFLGHPILVQVTLLVLILFLILKLASRFSRRNY